MTKKIRKKDVSISLGEDINLEYERYDNFSKKTRKLCALYNRERKKLVELRSNILTSMIKDYNNQ